MVQGPGAVKNGPWTKRRDPKITRRGSLIKGNSYLEKKILFVAKTHFLLIFCPFQRNI